MPFTFRLGSYRKPLRASALRTVILYQHGYYPSPLIRRAASRRVTQQYLGLPLSCWVLLFDVSTMRQRDGFCIDVYLVSSLYGCTCGQVMYYVTHYYIPGDQRYIAVLVSLGILVRGKDVLISHDATLSGCPALVGGLVCYNDRIDVAGRILDTGKTMVDLAVCSHTWTSDCRNSARASAAGMSFSSITAMLSLFWIEYLRKR